MSFDEKHAGHDVADLATEEGAFAGRVCLTCNTVLLQIVATPSSSWRADLKIVRRRTPDA